VPVTQIDLAKRIGETHSELRWSSSWGCWSGNCRKPERR